MLISRRGDSSYITAMVARPTMAVRRYRVFLTSLGQGDSSESFRRWKDLWRMEMQLRRRCLDLEGRVPSSMSTTETFNSGSTLSEVSWSMAGYCNWNTTLGPLNVSSSVHQEAKVANHNVVSLEKKFFAGTSSPYQERIHPSLLTIPNCSVCWGESVVIFLGLAPSFRDEGLDSGPSPGPWSGPMSDTPNLQQAALLQNLCHSGSLRHFHYCSRTTRRTDVIQFKGISKTKKAAEVVDNLSLEGEKGPAVLISGV